MIVAFYFRVPTGGSFELVTVPPWSYAVTMPDAVVPDRRGTVIPEDLDPCGVEHACSVCATRLLEPSADLQGDDWIEQFARVELRASAIGAWWPYSQAPEHGRFSTPVVAELAERFGQVELCPACFERHGDPDDWPDALLDQVYGPQEGPPRRYPEENPMTEEARLPTFQDMRYEAYGALGDVEDVLRSDWQQGKGPTPAQAEALSDARKHIAAAKQALNRAAP